LRSEKPWLICAFKSGEKDMLIGRLRADSPSPPAPSAPPGGTKFIGGGGGGPPGPRVADAIFFSLFDLTSPESEYG
jgi:hypothetical protein